MSLEFTTRKRPAGPQNFGRGRPTSPRWWRIRCFEYFLKIWQSQKQTLGSHNPYTWIFQMFYEFLPKWVGFLGGWNSAQILHTNTWKIQVLPESESAYQKHTFHIIWSLFKALTATGLSLSCRYGHGYFFQGQNNCQEFPETWRCLKLPTQWHAIEQFWSCRNKSCDALGSSRLLGTVFRPCSEPCSTPPH